MDDQRLRSTSSQSAASPTIPAEDACGKARCQSTPPSGSTSQDVGDPSASLTTSTRRPLTPCVPLPKSQDSGSHLSQMTAPLFTEDRCNTSSEYETTACDAEVTFINDRRTPS